MYEKSIIFLRWIKFLKKKNGINYYKKLGNNRNDIISNKGVLFQSIATQRSFIKSFAKMQLDITSNIPDPDFEKGENLMKFVK